MRRAKFKVVGRIDGAESATITIITDGESGLVSVRPFRRKREYSLTLFDVARNLVYDVVKAELREKQRTKRTTRKGVRR